MKKSSWMVILIVSVIFLLVPAASRGMAGPGEGGDTKKEPHRVPNIQSEIRIDAVLDEEAWQRALVLELNYEVFPGDSIKPPVRTRALLVYSRTHLYAAFRAYDPDPTAIRARITDRDAIGGDDWVGIMLDTFNDERRTFNFYCNSLGVQGDDIETPEGGGQEWDAIWESAGRITSWGYIVEMAIPFNMLRFPRRKDDQVWGVELIRSYPRNVQCLIGLFPRDRNNNCLMCQAEKLVGFAGIRPGKNIEFDPTLTSFLTQEREQVTKGKFVKKDSKLDPGLTARWGFTPNLTLSAAVNPDFSNVEADIPQLDINTRFALYYPEKRPFFMEGANFFSTFFRAVYTRTLGTPDWGIKLTGREGRHSIGFFSVQDSVISLLFPGSQGSRSVFLDMKTVGTVLRYQRDLGKSSALGLLVTDREGEGYFNRLAGIDGDLRITNMDRIRFQLLGSQTHYTAGIVSDYSQPAGNFWDSAVELSYLHDARHLHWHISYRDIGADFRADLGFMPQADYRGIDVGGAHTWNRPRGHWYTYLNMGAGYQLEKDHDNNLLFKALILNVNYTGPAQSFVNLTGNIGRRTFMGIEFNDNKLFFNAGLRPGGKLKLSVNGLVGRQIDFDNVQEGGRFMLEGFMEYRHGRHLSLRMGYIYERLNVDAGRLYTANITHLRLVYQFSKRTFLRTMLQYVYYNYNTQNYSFPLDPRFRHLFSQFLFSYKINPRTVLFLGYSDNYLGDGDIGLTQVNRTAFIKIGYALVL